jgi:hypothetical protein
MRLKAEDSTEAMLQAQRTTTRGKQGWRNDSGLWAMMFKVIFTKNLHCRGKKVGNLLQSI